MTAPLIWLGTPLVAALVFLLIVRSERGAALGGGTLALVLCLLAAILPVDTAISLLGISFRVDSAMQVLGRRFVLLPSDRLLLVLIYGLLALWFYASIASGIAQRVVALGFAITGLLAASLAVEPFLYGAVLIELAVLAAVPLLSPPDRPAGRGVLRFVIFQTLAMPFILLAGFLLSGVEASPGDLQLVLHASALLALGFAFLLAMFPFYAWIPQLCEEAHPFAVGFVLLLFPTVGMLFGLGFLDHYSFLRESPALGQALALAGLALVVTAGVWAAFERHIARLMGYALIVETGMSLIAISLPVQSNGLAIFFLMIIPRAVALLVWSLSLTGMQTTAASLRFADLQGVVRRLPVSSLGVAAASLALAGAVLLASFPSRLALLEQEAAVSPVTASWMLLGMTGLFVGAIRTLAVFVMAPQGSPREALESGRQRLAIGAGVAVLFILGIFPQWAVPLLSQLPLTFEHLGK
jgi:formate hydrogenlyase subunit 3/multisubunit Na+/H+ antiporter MnhD subunit